MTTITKLATPLLTGAIALAASLHALYRNPGEVKHDSPDAKHSACKEWEEESSKLTPTQRDTLKREGAVFRSAYFILSEELVADCEIRGQMSSYFARVLDFQSDDADREFAAQHSKDIVSVLRRIWPSLSGSKALTENFADESVKYALLADPSLEESNVAPLISDILEAETIDNNLARILFLRPMPMVKPALLNLQESAEETNDLQWQILNLALLQKIGDSSALPKLKKLLRNKDLSQAEGKYVTVLVSKAERGEEILFSDVENLEYEGTARSSVPHPR